MAAVPAAYAAWAAVAATAISGYASYETNKTQSEQAEADARASQGQARLEAERIRKQGEKQKSMARAASAENGLDVNEGTAIVINDKIDRDAEYDASMAEISGYNSSQRLKAEASTYKSNANTALTVGMLEAGSTALSSGAKTNNKNGWK